eukprot:CAMPEP_0170551504 /NCGR_PEP_ID=MMETSP0211-20121228/9498_1 /TAXON_ID=311385 /ORGANISM="Pseudokeronopsis sp., Strain OXSARD2" /LENGTH=71 /DNA_ID=CAMNT_0010858711 /DNA_START=207 /DNA_END=419 /DNA_ORIENTATION=+
MTPVGQEEEPIRVEAPHINILLLEVFHVEDLRLVEAYDFFVFIGDCVQDLGELVREDAGVPLPIPDLTEGR